MTKYKMPRSMSAKFVLSEKVQSRFLMCSVIVVAIVIVVGACVALKDYNQAWMEHHPTNGITPLDQLGSLIGGVSVFFAMIVAWLTANIITDKNARIEQESRKYELYIRAVANFRTLYEEFWKSDDIAIVRRWIISTTEYNEALQPILEARNATYLNMLSACRNEKLDKLDRFLSVLVRFKSFSASGELDVIESRQQSDPLRKLVDADYWITFIRCNRPDLLVYLQRHEEWGNELLKYFCPDWD